MVPWEPTALRAKRGGESPPKRRVLGLKSPPVTAPPYAGRSRRSTWVIARRIPMLDTVTRGGERSGNKLIYM